MTTKTDTEPERAEFEAWRRKHYDYDDLNAFEIEFAFAAYQAGRAALQSQDREDALRYRWLLEQAWFQEAFDRFGPDDGGYLPRFVGECARIIDHARRVEGDGE